MKKLFLVLTVCLIILAIFHGKIKASGLPEKEVMIEVSITNCNLFLIVNQDESFPINAAVLKLGRSKNIRLKPSVDSNGQYIFFLDAKVAFKLKKYGIRSVICHSPEGRKKVRISEYEKNKILSSLP